MNVTEWHLDGSVRELLLEASGGADLDALRAAGRELGGARRAGMLLICDLLRAGWSVTLDGGLLVVAPPADARCERDWVRDQLALERDRQLETEPVRAFLRRMEAPRCWRGRLVSVFSLMRDGRALAEGLSRATGALDAVVHPYVQVARPGERCDETGLDAAEIWRYFRHTWLTPYRSTPGRGVMFLVRDAAAPHHPVIGIAMIGSAAAHIAGRDRWIGWEPDMVIAESQQAPTEERAAWLTRTLDQQLSEVDVTDLLADGVLAPGELRDASANALERLRAEAQTRRREHARYGDALRLRDVPRDDDARWRDRSRTPLYRAKRAELLDVLLRARSTVSAALRARSPREALGRLAECDDGRRAIRVAARRWKASQMGTAIADIQVCGALSPYREILGGKLVAALVAGREVREHYEAQYEGAPSVIASSVAGRPIVRDARLAALSTTSLFSTGSSQYNRLRGHPERGGCGTFVDVGQTAGYGSVHISEETAAALAGVTSAAAGGRRAFSLFGEGVSPRLRQIRQGLDVLGLPSHLILRHGARRTVYVVPLARNARRYLCGLDPSPEFPDEPRGGQASDEIVAAWRDRWLSGRVARPGVLSAVGSHTLHRPVTHGARPSARPERG